MEKNEETGKETQLYIMTLGVLEPYRRCGVATQMLEYILNLVKDDAEFADLLTVVIHVQTNNDAALAMYKKHGFEITGHKDNYYQVCATAATASSSSSYSYSSSSSSASSCAAALLYTLNGRRCARRFRLAQKLEPSDCHILTHVIDRTAK